MVNEDSATEPEFGETQTQERILGLMCTNPTISAKAIAKEIGIAPRGVEENIRGYEEIWFGRAHGHS
ncbi:MAG: winged helix-turn-helix domain-containing protein [Synergistaceae bacterium]|nr:winged helix-turn-helix domain-containing protein [Synergistaceae bacterium]